MSRLSQELLEVERPLVLLGTGRCGSTLLHRLLSGHPQAAWLTHMDDRLPGLPWVSRTVIGTLCSPATSRAFIRLRDTKLLKPIEAYGFWNRYCPGFASPCRDLTASDLLPSHRRATRKALTRLLSAGRNRWLLKVTGWPRVGFLQALLPKAKFVHVYRDGRAVASSFLNVQWWSGWRGPDNWSWGDLSSDQRRRWERSGRSFAALAGIQWELLMEAHERALEGLRPDDYMEIRYEALCAAPMESLRSILEFWGLDWNDRLARHLSRFSVENVNSEWPERIGSAEAAKLEEAIVDSLARWGYE